LEEYFTIGELAKKSEVSIQTIRYYEKRGLISVKARTSSQYRLFSVNTIQDIQFIKQAQAIGFKLKEIQELLRISNDDNYFPQGKMQHFASNKIREIDEQLEQLNKLKTLLLAATKQSNPKQNCPILKSLQKEDK